VRFTVTAADPLDPQARPTLIVSAQAVTGYPPEMYEKGMTVFICTDYRQSAQDPLAGHKTTSYFPRLVALRTAQERGCNEALWFTPANLLAEGCISNVFLVKNGELRTPPLDTPVLPGIAREVVLEQAAALGITAHQVPCTIDDLLDADEVFLTNSVMEVMPVTRVERKAIANEKPGPVTRRLLEAYRTLTQSPEPE
jgi:branched-chain amino acid aminotransferase